MHGTDKQARPTRRYYSLSPNVRVQFQCVLSLLFGRYADINNSFTECHRHHSGDNLIIHFHALYHNIIIGVVYNNLGVPEINNHVLAIYLPHWISDQNIILLTIINTAHNNNSIIITLYDHLLHVTQVITRSLVDITQKIDSVFLFNLQFT